MLQVFAIGNAGGQPEMRYTPQGNAVTTVRLGCRAGKDSTSWVTVVAWHGLAEIVNKHVGKGDKLAVTGRLQVREFTRQDGSRGTTVEIVADNVEFAGSRRIEDQESREAPGETSEQKSHGHLIDAALAVGGVLAPQ